MKQTELQPRNEATAKHHQLHVIDESGGFSLCRRISRLWCSYPKPSRKPCCARQTSVLRNNVQEWTAGCPSLVLFARPETATCQPLPAGNRGKEACARLHYLLLWQKRKRPRCFRNVAFINAGNDLLSHTLSRAVQSALRGLTSVFGMGTGGSPAVRSPTSRSRQRLAVSFQQMLR